jgi:calcineurin-like phosphoesterase family protein
MFPWGFTSDQHFGHRNIIKFAGRPFVDLVSMHEALIANYNAVVPEGATVVWVGDAFFRSNAERARATLARMNGEKILVRGNHDGNVGRCHRYGFKIVTDELRLHLGGRACRVSHFPYLGTKHAALSRPDDRFADRRPPRVPGEVLIHGHTHSKQRRNGNQIHVGVDAWDCAPVPLATVEALIREV